MKFYFLQRGRWISQQNHIIECLCPWLHVRKNFISTRWSVQNGPTLCFPKHVLIFRVLVFSFSVLPATEGEFNNRQCFFHLWIPLSSGMVFLVTSWICFSSHFRSSWPSKQLSGSPLTRNLIIERTTWSAHSSSQGTESGSQERELRRQSPSWQSGGPWK